jgi:hypothetical protein
MEKMIHSSKQKSRERFFETVKRIQKANQEANPDEIMDDVLKAQQAIRTEQAQKKSEIEDDRWAGDVGGVCAG